MLLHLFVALEGVRLGVPASPFDPISNATVVPPPLTDDGTPQLCVEWMDPFRLEVVEAVREGDEREAEATALPRRAMGDDARLLLSSSELSSTVIMSVSLVGILVPGMKTAQQM